MWVMLIKKLPVVVSPPRGSLFWAVPWENRFLLDSLVKRMKQYQKLYGLTNEEALDSTASFCGPNSYQEEIDILKTSVGINFLGERIKLWNTEYSIVSDEHMDTYLDEKNQMYDLMADGQAVEPVKIDFKSKEERLYYEAALLDGCNTAQAQRVMVGMEPDISVYPPIGWYRLKKDYADKLGFTDYEQSITDGRNEEC
jgi:hypothetical protein